MLVSYRWLQEYVKTTTKPESLGEKFLMTSSEIEKLIPVGEQLENIVTGKILTCEKHPNADRLNVTTVNIGSETKTIVCGAPNVAQGQVVLVALPGAKVVHGKEVLEIKESEFRGVVSQGMLCGASELGLQIIEEERHLWIQPANTPIGIPAREALELDDTVLDLEITPNRPDLLSYVGLAREVSAFEQRKLLLPPLANLNQPLTHTASIPVSSHINHLAPCNRLAFVVLKVSKNVSSPWWMQRRLLLAGMRPLNAIVDVTNYVMLELGQPLHAYNLDSLKKPGIKKIQFHAEKAAEKEVMVTLDGSKRTIEPGDSIITVHGQIVDLAGIMGGKESSIQEDVKEVVLEAATFAGGQIRRTSRRLGLRSEASTRFEKGLDSELPPVALARAVYLLEQMGVAEQASPLIDEYPTPKKNSVVLSIPMERFENLMGLRISVIDAKKILEHLGFTIHSTSKTQLKCSPPSWRADVTMEEDVIEELIRIWGFERIQPTLPQGAVKAPQRNQAFYRKSSFQDRAVQLGYQENIHIPFCTKKQLDIFGYTNAERLDNPLSAEQEYLIPSHVIPLLEQAATSQKFERNRFFEIGAVFEAPHQEKRMVSALLRDSVSPEVLFREAKQLLESMFSGYTCTYTASNTVPVWTDKSVSQTIVVEGQEIGTLGLVKPSLVTTHKIRRSRSVVFFEFNFELLKNLPTKKVLYVAPSTYPAVDRDITLIVDESVTWNQVETLISTEHATILQSWMLVDIFRGASIPSQKKSWTLRFIYQSSDHTLIDEEVDVSQNALKKILQDNLHATIS